MADGMFVKIEAVHPGLHPSMPIVDIRTADGEIAQFEVSTRSIADCRIGVGWPVGRRDDGALLIEPGSECISFGPNFGRWRVYVPADSLVRGDAGSRGEACQEITSSDRQINGLSSKTAEEEIAPPSTRDGGEAGEGRDGTGSVGVTAPWTK